ncbi:MAG: hypothetical protein ABIT37_06920 [Luteolibacter sp.]
MNTKHPSISAISPLTWMPHRFTALVGAVIFSTSVAAFADIPDASSRRFGGIYKVTSSTDPIFPVTQTREYFLDFGSGIQPGKFSGSVAVSERQNPHVKVRIMAWQYFPDQGKMLIGNPYAEGSRKAVAAGVWRMTGNGSGVLFERGRYRVVLNPADPKDY